MYIGFHGGPGPTFHQVRYHGHASGLHLLYQSDRADNRTAGGIWYVDQKSSHQRVGSLINWARRDIPMARTWPLTTRQYLSEDSVSATLPPLEVQRHLLELYFTYVHPVYPVVHKTLFWMEFEAS